MTGYRPRGVSVTSPLSNVLFFSAAAVLAAGGIWFVFIPIRLHLRFVYRNGNYFFRYSIQFARLFRFGQTLSADSGKQSSRRPNAMALLQRRASDWMKRRLPIVLSRGLPLPFRTLEHFYWTTTIGADDAALTSWIAGGLWALQAFFVGWMARYVTFLSPPQWNVHPDYGKPQVALEIRCIFRFTIGQIILAVLPRPGCGMRGVISDGTRSPSD